ncbi:diguanylate cyclase [Iodobacter sp. CM08]|uniref:diguanylate cyclase domain-containing protein n=1 Tax=Iodobacter sp. CM08 TaxID=3085902 RepID=UPI0029810FFC|nr:diguanylate cyclase [Iodobacter sp. CM08]MDW5415217.1 diguanylate cyclase [Iodobacter sp. CM08]
MQVKSSRWWRKKIGLSLHVGRIGSWPLAKKLLLLNVLGIASTLLVCLALFSASYSYIATQRLKSEALANAHILANNVAPMLVFNDQKAAKTLVHSFTDMPDLRYLSIVNTKNKTFVEWGVLAADSPPPFLIKLLPHSAVEMTYDHIVVLTPVALDGEPLGKIKLQIGFDAIYTETLQFFLFGLVLIAIAIVIASIILNRLQVKALAPIFELSAIAEKVASERNYSLRAQPRGRDELGRLSYHFNQMLAKIEAWETDIRAELDQSKESARCLDLLANYDNLTKLPNRHYFNQALAKMVEQSLVTEQFSALMFIDLDNFKYVNDQYGHEAGDAVLIIIAQRLNVLLRSTDMPCRLGGDEFAVILPHIANIEAVSHLADRLVAAVNQDIIIHGDIMPVGASIGIACCPLHARDEKMLLHYADLAMYQAKKMGKNMSFVYSE